MQQMQDAQDQQAEPWYAHQMYSRYWRHYHQAMHWLHRHKEAYRKAVESFYYLLWHSRMTAEGHRYADWSDDERPVRRSHCPSELGRVNQRESQSQRWQYPTPSSKHQASEEKESTSEDEEDDDDSGSGDEIECDVSNMEITEELRQYFAQTERHREELRRQQQLEAECQDSYVAADHDLHVSAGRTVQPPTERPGERRVAEMKRLYGEDAAKIQGMETAMQLTFDRNCDKKQPKYWPIIPLKL
ncbi:gem-associated protein 8 isoform X1 [Latimeria chalumnae]|uniref:Gem nuclear organelle associated protein 8 n=1 Tax=Latimeria chalumnae TaxID=7897 RepID=H3AUX8_LATCH|nr:PREDICTED: gem-associated protein 8 isoform X2 [Latimeria chalumnae]|eukprot:XP_005996189.1 PREDICTED: gem-associated protein 8 isoform X2 [Latimeria chalumnae]